MIERRPALGFLAHAILIIGVLIVALPLYIAFVASTHTAEEMVQMPMPMLPGPHLIENYLAALSGGGGGPGSNVAVGRMMLVSLVTALIITFGKISISLLSAFAMGMAIPHLGAALAFERLTTMRQFLARHSLAVERASGTVMVGMGILIFTGALIDIFRYFQAFTVVL